MLVAFTSAREPQAMVKVLVGIVVIALLGLAGFTYLTLHWSYSEGERAGYVQKLSRRGFICKTWEGEMAMVTMPGTVAEKFLFTVPNEAVAAKVNAAVGKRMALHYEQHRWLPSSCFGDTEYFVTDVRVTE
jgi:restriction endonuclease Mrr